MRNKQAKRLRRIIYKDFSLRSPRKYYITSAGVVINTDPRRAYLKLKEQFKCLTSQQRKS